MTASGSRSSSTTSPREPTPSVSWPSTLAASASAGVRACAGFQAERSSFERWTAALANNPNATLKLYPRLNHLFLEGDGVSMPAEYERPGKIPSQVLDDIAAWVRAVSAARIR